MGVSFSLFLFFFFSFFLSSHFCSGDQVRLQQQQEHFSVDSMYSFLWNGLLILGLVFAVVVMFLSVLCVFYLVVNFT